MVVRLFCLCGVLLPVFAGVAFGQGTYQHAKDGKTIVWNNDPKPGDAAAWFGDRDIEGYATGFGTLSWYTAQQQEKSTLYARYFGRMVRGKFDGPVNVHSKGKTDHAIFVDGQRTTRWAAGRAPSRSVAQQPTKPAKPERIAEAPAEGPPTVRRAENVQRSTPLGAVGSTEPEANAQRPMAEAASAASPAVPEPEAGAEGSPAVRETENAPATANSSSGEQLRKSSRAGSPTRLRTDTPKPVREPAGPQTSNSESFPEQAAQQPALSESRTGPVEDTPAERSPTVRETENVQRPTPNAQRPMPEVASAGSAAVAEPEAPAEGPRVVQAESALTTLSSLPGEQPATPKDFTSEHSSSESFREQAAQPPMEDTPSLLIPPSEKSTPTPPTDKKSPAEVEDSLQSLVQPPSSLFEIPETVSSPEASPRLTKDQVIKIANAKARTHGYNRIDYGMAEPQYNAAYKIWSVSYEERAADGMEGKHFSIIVDDKTKGAVFMLRR